MKDAETACAIEQSGKAMADYWDESAKTYDERHELNDPALWMRTLSSYVGENKDARILDVATGTGMIADFLASAGYENVIGMDVSEEMMCRGCERALASGNDIEFVYGNTLAIPFEDESFDVVINSRLLWTLTDPALALSEWRRVLKPGGRVVAINELEDSGIEVDMNWGYSEKTGLDTFPFAQVSREGVLEEFEKAGFANMEVSYMKGCRMVSSDRENWFAFLGVKA